MHEYGSLFKNDETCMKPVITIKYYFLSNDVNIEWH
jgi:hypothetical protein